MPKKKTDEVEETAETTVTENAAETTEETVAAAADSEAAVEASVEESTEEAPAKKAAPKKKAAEKKPAAKADESGEAPVFNKGKRMEKIGIVASDKMMKTVTVNVDRLVKHPTYRKYVRKRKKFMAHDELGSKIGDKVRIVETRPTSARKRWRVIEIVQKAER
jgi:small subunit ribosomal protein S17